jgi:hypothetical protein
MEESTKMYVLAMEKGESLMGLKPLKDDVKSSRRKIYRTNAEVGHVKLEGV